MPNLLKRGLQNLALYAKITPQPRSAAKQTNTRSDQIDFPPDMPGRPKEVTTMNNTIKTNHDMTYNPSSRAAERTTCGDAILTAAMFSFAPVMLTAIILFSALV